MIKPLVHFYMDSVVAIEFMNVHSIIMYNTDSSYVYSAVKATVEVH